MKELQYPFDPTLILQKKRVLRRQLLQQAPGRIKKRVAIVSGSTIGDIKAILELFLLDKGIEPEFWTGEYGLFYEDVLFSAELRSFAPDLLYIHTSNRNLRAWPLPGDTTEAAAQKLAEEYGRFEAVWQAAKALGCPVIQNNFEAPLWRGFGNLDAADTRGRVWFTRQLNQNMAEYARANRGFYIHDLEYLAACHGLDSWCDTAAWYGYKYCCAVKHIPHLCHSLAGLAGSLFGMSRKCAVTDLDNTLWGGVIGEVGAEGVELGGESPAGMAFAELQGYLKALSTRGVMLAVASKNEEDVAKSGFARPDSPLRAEDFLCFEANWGPKTNSLANIANKLNIGIDSFVFIDDNPAERDIVGQVYPQVSIPEIGEPENSIRLIDRAAYFEVSSLSADDVQRNKMYQQNIERQKEQTNFANYSDYLLSLNMRAEIGPFRGEQLERVTQLINKTNQFNLTTRRYTAAEVEQAAASKEYITLSGRLVDKFGDNGIVSAIIGSVHGQALHIDLWVMSCRVFKRDLELAMFDALVAQARDRGLEEIWGVYLPTAKNGLTADFYGELGFAPVAQGPDKREFRCQIPEEYSPKNHVIQPL